jgi:hypothetical protein
MKQILAALISATVLALIIYTQITLFVIQPIGIVPEGKTIVILRLNITQFIDSADAMCQRQVGNVNLLCRIAMMEGVATKSTVIFKLPYSSILYEISTSGKTYEH